MLPGWLNVGAANSSCGVAFARWRESQGSIYSSVFCSRGCRRGSDGAQGRETRRKHGAAARDTHSSAASRCCLCFELHMITPFCSSCGSCLACCAKYPVVCSLCFALLFHSCVPAGDAAFLFCVSTQQEAVIALERECAPRAYVFVCFVALRHLCFISLACDFDILSPNEVVRNTSTFDPMWLLPDAAC